MVVEGVATPGGASNGAAGRGVRRGAYVMYIYWMDLCVGVIRRASLKVGLQKGRHAAIKERQV